MHIFIFFCFSVQMSRVSSMVTKPRAPRATAAFETSTSTAWVTVRDLVTGATRVLPGRQSSSVHATRMSLASLTSGDTFSLYLVHVRKPDMTSQRKSRRQKMSNSGDQGQGYDDHCCCKELRMNIFTWNQLPPSW